MKTRILHYMKGDCEAEYIVLTESDDSPDEWLTSGFEFKGEHDAEIEDSFKLPLDTTLATA